MLLIQEHDAMACATLTKADNNGKIMKLILKPAASTRVFTIANLRRSI
jgi:hypothetical protein